MAALCTQLLKPTQSLRASPRAELRLHTRIFQAGTARVVTYRRERLIARCCFLMHGSCHLQTNPVFKRTGLSIGGARRCDTTPDSQSAPANRTVALFTQSGAAAKKCAFAIFSEYRLK